MQIQVDGLSLAAPTDRSPSAKARSRKGCAAQARWSLNCCAWRGSTNRAPFATETIDIAQLLLDCVGDYVAIADRKGVDLGVGARADASLPGNREELRVLFSNLIENAVRYTPAGGTVDVSLKVRARGRSSRCSIRGVDFRRAREARVFDRFYRGAPGTEGSGLGLAIARRIAERNGLALTVENRPDGRSGVLARVELPLGAPRTAPASSSFSPHSGALRSLYAKQWRGLPGSPAKSVWRTMMNVKHNMKRRYCLWAPICAAAVLLSLAPAFAYTGQELAKDAKVSITEARAIALKAHPGNDHRRGAGAGRRGNRPSLFFRRQERRGDAGSRRRRANGARP